MAKKKQETEGSVVKKSNFGHEIWGLIFLAVGVLILISIISHYADKDQNILGYFLGTSLSEGLVFFFGYIPVFMVPLSIGYLGWTRLRNEPLKVRSITYAFLFTVESCLILSIYHLPFLAENSSYFVKTNYIGFLFIKLVLPVFGPNQFGPYFITILSLFITLLAWFRISPQKIFAGLKIASLWIISKLFKSFARYLERLKQERIEKEKQRELDAAEKQKQLIEKKAIAVMVPVVAQKALKEPAQQKSKKGKKEEPVDDVPFPPETRLLSIESNDNELDNQSNDSADVADNGDEAKKQLEQELAAFRAKKREPIKIMSIETTEVEVDDTHASNVENVQFKHITNDVDEELTETVPLDLAMDGVEEIDIPVVPQKPYEIPRPSILPDPPPQSSYVDKESIERNSMILEKTLMNFAVEGKVVFVSPGPVVTRYEIELAPGVKVSRVLNLHDDISMAVNGQRIRIEAPIPGKSAIGIELPNGERQIVHFKNILISDAFSKTKAKLPVVIGTNISGAPYITDITKMPHVLIAGQTGSGKSVCINSVICSLLMTKTPDELRLIMIDPKKVELAFYENIPHLLSPVVTESKEAVKALQWGVIEMERRYRMLAKVGARNIDSFNTRVESGKISDILDDADNKPLPFIVIIVDELADLMMTASKDVEGLIQRIAQLARAVGIHLIVATQRPSVDIITGPIKANLTSRIGFRTIQSTDSRTILGHVGAEKLLGMGDMLFLRNGAPEIERFHGAFISEEDVEKIVSDIRRQNYKIDKIESFHEATGGDTDDDQMFADGDRDELFEEAARIIVSIGQGSTSLLQRRMKIGYARAGRLMDELERAGFVGPPDGSKAREVLVKPDEIDELLCRIR
jgi:DNA segregation ATPase FtsK/SpoIIIE-like protein